MAKGTTREFEVFKRELLLAPRQVRVRLLERVEEFLAALDYAKSYPFDFIFFSITDHRPESPDSTLLSAQDVSLELARVLDEVGRTLPVSAESINEPVLTVGDLAKRWGVSAATVLRWRRQGLASRFFRFGGGRRQVGVRESLARSFETHSRRLIRRALSRRRIDSRERQAVIEAALVGLAREEAPGKILARLGEQFVLREGKIQRMLAAAATQAPGLAAFTHAGVSRRESECIFQEVSSGTPIDEVARRYQCSARSVKGIYLRGRARSLLRRKIKVLYNEEFESPGADEAILNAPALSQSTPADTAPADELPVYLKGIAGVALLTREKEAALFRKYNYLKFLAVRAREKINPRRPCEALVEQVEKLLTRAEAVREHLVRANLRLVVAIARRHRGPKTDFPALVSNGNMALLDAIEAFDYSRGNRFSTYAGWAIVRRFARTVPEENYAVTGVEEEILENSAKVEVDYTALGAAAVKNGIVRALAGLPERERVVIESRFGLGRAKSPSTLQEIGSRFGVTKERIRQIEAHALSRLRQIVETNVPELVP